MFGRRMDLGEKREEWETGEGRAPLSEYMLEEERGRQDFKRGVIIGFLGGLGIVLLFVLVLAWNGLFRVSNFNAGGYGALERTILNKVHI